MESDLRRWMRLVEGFHIPKVLYHGSKPELLDKIKKEGLTAATDTSWREFGQGVYLALTADVARKYGQLVFAIKVSKLNRKNMVADDDELAAHFDGEWGDNTEGNYGSDEYRPDGIHSATWLDSLRICHQCQYIGDIPPAALTVVPNPKSEVRAKWRVEFEFPNGEHDVRDITVPDEDTARRMLSGSYWDRDGRGKPRIISIKPAPP